VSDDLGLTTQVKQDCVEVALSGDLDMGGAFKLEPELDRLLAEKEVSRVVVDLGGVRFVDSAGLGALLASHERAKDAGVEMKLANPSDPVRRILDLTGTGEVLSD
jgi:anti-anti-sigma factor